MEITNQDIEKWQKIWQQLCDMAYFRKNIVNELAVIPTNGEYESLIQNHIKTNYTQITLDFTWKKVSELKDINGEFLEPQVVPELQEIYIPRLLFKSPGVYSWFKHSFPNCVIFFWEDDI